MARRKAEKKPVDPVEKARLKKLRAAERRAERKRKREKGDGGDQEPARRSTSSTSARVSDKVADRTWLARSSVVGYAIDVINHHKARPYWLSIPHGRGDGNPPPVDFYPCTSFRTSERAYFGFLVRTHRDLMFERLPDARKELTDTVRRLAPTLLG